MYVAMTIVNVTHIDKVNLSGPSGLGAYFQVKPFSNIRIKKSQHLQRLLETRFILSNQQEKLNYTKNEVKQIKVSSQAQLAAHIPNNKGSHVILCEKIFRKDKTEMMLALLHQQLYPKVILPAKYYIKTASDCGTFKRTRQYIPQPLNDEEAGFPIAFSIVMYKDVEHVERLLRAIYRPQNYYCIHVDAKSPEETYMAMKTIAVCFDNVVMAPRVYVEWGEVSVLDAELVCMEKLLKFPKWTYLLNLAGQEWPLKTNWELVKILKAYNGANDIETTYDM